MERQADIHRRRDFLRKTVLWFLGIVTASLVYPLSRFTSFTIKPKPRYITINKILLPGDYHTERDFILFVLENGPVAVSRRCTHLGCRVSYREELGLIECPCHQSRFTTEGVRTAGPAEKNLPQLAVAIQEDKKGQTSGYVVTV